MNEELNTLAYIYDYGYMNTDINANKHLKTHIYRYCCRVGQ